MLKVSGLLLVTIVLLFVTVISENVKDNGNRTVDEFSVGSEGSRLLSRRKRFLIFPVGSSLQLVFCLQTLALIPIGEIFLFGNTAALAWNLPTDPMFFEMLKGKKYAQRRVDSAQNIAYVDDKGRVIARVPYARKSIVNPAFAKRSIDGNKKSYKEKLKIKLNRQKMHERQTYRDYLKKDGLDDYSIEFHRNSRLELFGKLETLFKALGKEGRQCVLYKLCKSAQGAEQGTFLQEFLRALFTLPKGKEFYEDHHQEYDRAHNSHDDCSIKYPGCDI